MVGTCSRIPFCTVVREPRGALLRGKPATCIAPVPNAVSRSAAILSILFLSAKLVIEHAEATTTTGDARPCSRTQLRGQSEHPWHRSYCSCFAVENDSNHFILKSRCLLLMQLESEPAVCVGRPDPNQVKIVNIRQEHWVLRFGAPLFCVHFGTRSGVHFGPWNQKRTAVGAGKEPKPPPPLS